MHFLECLSCSIIGPIDNWSLFNQGPYTYTNVTSLSVSLALLLNDHTSHIMRHETDKEVTFVYVYGPWLKRLQVSVGRKV